MARGSGGRLIRVYRNARIASAGERVTVLRAFRKDIAMRFCR